MGIRTMPEERISSSQSPREEGVEAFTAPLAVIPNQETYRRLLHSSQGHPVHRLDCPCFLASAFVQ